MSLLKKLGQHLRLRLLGDIPVRLARAEYHAVNRRFYAVEQVAEYLLGAQVPGDYYEFGVYQGTTFAHANKLLASLFPEMRFIACDSFEGLPVPSGIDAKDGYTSHFYGRQFLCTEQDFLANLRRAAVDLDRVLTIQGWFNQSLNDKTRSQRSLGKVAFAWIDCDLYESTVPVLEFITPMLSAGCALLFDDWRCFRNLPEFGQQRAVREWLQANPRIKLAELLSFGWNGQVFTVVDC